MGGDCTEAFKEFDVNHVRDAFHIILQMALVRTFGSTMSVVKVYHMARQLTKSGSKPDEVHNIISFHSYHEDSINILQMAVVRTFVSTMPVVKVGRMAGQFAKPRSEPDEVHNGVSLPMGIL
mmetsp:Transcript_43305/g.65444  ORF Transcript_43305/g.65444 Transcript_43305/m.65444 type:complete len:122 (-) Transcript_43305:461-826(-)